MTIAVLANDCDDDGDARALVEASAPAHGTARLTDAGAVEYTPAPDYHGSDRFTYVVGDGSGLTAPAAVEVTVLPVNDAPWPGAPRQRRSCAMAWGKKSRRLTRRAGTRTTITKNLPARSKSRSRPAWRRGRNRGSPARAASRKTSKPTSPYRGGNSVYLSATQTAKGAVTRRCELLDVARSTVYDRPTGISAEDLALMRLVDEIH